MPTIDITQVIKWIIRLMFWGLVVTSWVFIIAMVLSAILGGGGTGTLVSDLLALVQLWSPFHVASMISWIVISSTAYLTYRLAIVLFGFLNILIGED